MRKICCIEVCLTRLVGIGIRKPFIIQGSLYGGSLHQSCTKINSKSTENQLFQCMICISTILLRCQFKHGTLHAQAPTGTLRTGCYDMHRNCSSFAAPGSNFNLTGFPLLAVLGRSPGLALVSSHCTLSFYILLEITGEKAFECWAAACCFGLKVPLLSVACAANRFG